MILGVSGPESTADQLAAKFQHLFGRSALLFRAPGRINLIGEHTDYNQGFVMPMAIESSTWVAAAKRQDRCLEVYSETFDERISFSLNSLSGPPRGHWGDFIRGVAATLQEVGYALCGADLLVHGEVPVGVGLSSSASLEVSVAFALAAVAGISIPRREMAMLCQKAEHEYTGTRCGVMDQFAACFSFADHALILDCRSLEYRLLAIPSDVRMVVCNTGVRHQLAVGEYNLRRSECEQAVKLLQPSLPEIRALRDVEVADLEKYKRDLSERLYRRCRHVISENQRVVRAAKALQSGDKVRVGQLMNQSHASLRDDYEVSCKELDLLVDLASSMQGVYGARMMGGGFGGCTVNMVSTGDVSTFCANIARMYAHETGISAETYVCEAAQAAGNWPTKGTQS